ncbi:hypothetical protein V2J09_005245 [Rumex salicifolius]
MVNTNSYFPVLFFFILLPPFHSLCMSLDTISCFEFLNLEFSPMFSIVTLYGLKKTWCVTKPSSSESELQNNINYACQVINCGAIQMGGSCYEPRQLASHASVVINLFYQQNGRRDFTCYFSNSGLIVLSDPKLRIINDPGGNHSFTTSIPKRMEYRKKYKARTVLYSVNNLTWRSYIIRKPSPLGGVSSFLSLWEKGLQASTVRSAAAANATKTAASSEHVTCCAPTCT